MRGSGRRRGRSSRRRGGSRRGRPRAVAGHDARVAELRAGSEEFGRIRDTDPVHAPAHRTKTLTHPDVGRLRVNCDVLTGPCDDQQVVFMTAGPGTPSARSLRRPATVGPDFSAR
ncbi:hypothetical protein [Streptomyces sp. NPDC101776]|uniref:MmyB family transcriptional regulator n=1 Tax=Streptomyces sp. NPDC101776 TaxID=3366146 RepID=UPI0038116A7A